VRGRNRITGNRSVQSRPLAPLRRTHGSRLPTMPRGEPQAGGDYIRPAAGGIKKKTPPPSGGSASEARADRESFVGLAWQRRGTYEGEWEERGGGSLRLVSAPFRVLRTCRSVRLFGNHRLVNSRQTFNPGVNRLAAGSKPLRFRCSVS